MSAVFFGPTKRVSIERKSRSVLLHAGIVLLMTWLALAGATTSYLQAETLTGSNLAVSIPTTPSLAEVNLGPARARGDLKTVLPAIPPLTTEDTAPAAALLIADATAAKTTRGSLDRRRVADGGVPSVSAPVSTTEAINKPIELIEMAELVVSEPLHGLGTAEPSNEEPLVAQTRNVRTKSTSSDQAGPIADQSERPRDEPARIEWTESAVRITPSMAALRPRLRQVLNFYYNRPLNTKDDSSWSVMHSMLGYGLNAPLAVGGPRGRRTNGVAWMCENNPCAGQRLLYLANGYVKGRQGPGFEGHPGQFLSMLAQIGVSKDRPLRVQGRKLTVHDLVKSEMVTCYAETELTFKLIAFSHYLGSDAVWLNSRRETWNVPKMLQIELAQPVNGAACGGTHRIMSCSCAVKMRQREGLPIDGVYATAAKYVRDYQRYAFSLQHRNGSFSSDWFKRRSSWGDEDRQLQTTGHILEWLVYSLPRNELSDPRVVRSVNFLSDLMSRNRYHDWEVGPRGHALRALSLYQQRVFEQPLTAAPLAKRPASSKR